MNKVTLVFRILYGLLFFIFGLNHFLEFIPMPTEMPEKITAFMAGLKASGYFFPLLKGTEAICGLMLLTNFLVPLALVVLAPILINILCVNIFLDTSGIPMGLIMVIVHSYLSFFAMPYCNVIRQLFVK